ncbi:type II secretion system protein [Nocardioides sp. GY 10127]|uniref:type IV pilus modification PilV family protein n=1 Tax=Nocardioides sp. GY 10127 TaxID=2569762 RepID=UPI0010A86034|nr:type II secretion system protein [Nocardioides sp. GY 10127]TIC78909.1 type II secretion system protein [Nocardioides sp. GY 10127]
MSRCADQGAPEAQPRTRPADGGFSLVEVLVALAILVVLLVASLPVVLGGIRANATARSLTQGKSMALAELERMRNLPWHVAPAAGDFIDVLDRYHPDLVAPAAAPTCTDASGDVVEPTAANEGWVSATAGRCDWEPAGPFYRTVLTGADRDDLDGWVLVLSTQFLNDSTPPSPVTPPAGWDSGVVGHDTPPSAQVGVVVAALEVGAHTTHPVVSATQIGRARRASTRARATADATTLAIGTTTTLGTDEAAELSVQAGILHLSAGLSYTSTASAALTSLNAGVSGGSQADGASVNLASPPSVSAAAGTASAGQLTTAGCSLVCWGSTSTSAVSVNADAAAPSVGSPGAPVNVAIGHDGSGATALKVGAGSGALIDPALLLSGPLVSVVDPVSGSGTGSDCSVTTSGTTIRVGASGWAQVTPSGTDAAALGLPADVVRSCATARAGRIAILPTLFAPNGLLQVDLASAVARCQVTGAAHTPSASASWSGSVRRWTPLGYTSIGTLSSSNVTDPLAALNLDSLGLGALYGDLGDYVESIASASSGGATIETETGRASASLPGVLTLRTAPVRLAVGGSTLASSTVSVTVGAVACSAEDAR